MGTRNNYCDISSSFQEMSKKKSWSLPSHPSIRPSIHPSVRPSVRPSARPSVRPSVCLSVCPKTSSIFYSCNKISLIKVTWYVLRVKNMHPGSPSDPSQTASAKANPRLVYSISKAHGKSCRSQVRPILLWQSQIGKTQF